MPLGYTGMNAHASVTRVQRTVLELLTRAVSLVDDLQRIGATPRANDDVDGGAVAIFRHRVFKERRPREGVRSHRRRNAPIVPGAGIEPASLESKASVLPLDDPERSEIPDSLQEWEMWR